MYKFHSDAGHGWLAVSKAELVRLGIADQITEYSYQHGEIVYLEEDVDAGLFISARALTDEDIQEVYDGDHSFIRSYGNYTGGTLTWKD